MDTPRSFGALASDAVRLDLHNFAVDQGAASAHLCAMTDLRTGRVCVLPPRHRGCCQFLPKEVARISTGGTHPVPDRCLEANR